MKSSVTRRRFMTTVAVGLSAAPTLLHAAEPSRWRFLTNQEAKLVDAISEQIVPADEDPGASDVGVVNFIDKQLSTRYRRHQQTYREGLPGVDETSRAMFTKGFLSLTSNQQIEVLKSLESGKAAGETWRKQSSSAFFRLIRDHTIQGFYGGPQHGGNRGYASYKMLKLDYPQIIGQNRYRRS